MPRKQALIAGHWSGNRLFIGGYQSDSQSLYTHTRTLIHLHIISTVIVMSMSTQTVFFSHNRFLLITFNCGITIITNNLKNNNNKHKNKILLKENVYEKNKKVSKVNRVFN